jgi:mannose-6-phosphate isomerase-like protein (cupin superfamily)
MTKTLLGIVAVAAVLSPVAVWVVRAQSKPTTATYISKEEIDAVSKAEQDKSTQDMNVKVMDLGYEHFSLGIIHRGTTQKPPAAPGGAGAANASAPPPEPCGRHMDTLPPGGTPGGLTHDFQTEGYYIVSGSGTMMTDGYIVNGRHTDIPMNGWSCGGMAYGVKKVEVKVGDVVIVPPNTVHGWADIPDHVDYLSFRPSQSALEAGYVNPIIQSMKP